MPRHPDLPCAQCGELMWRGTTSLPDGQARCLPCRRAKPATHSRSQYTRGCIDCGGPCYATRCRPCYNANVKAGADPEAARRRKQERAVRQRRERAARGLTLTERRNLGVKWRNQGRRCTYCDALATQVDHVMPLALGGTNYEGNLTPCCASCNVRKSDSLLIEWKWKVRVKRDRVEPPPLPVRERKPRAYQQTVMLLLTCEQCDGTFISTRQRRYCTKKCNDRACHPLRDPKQCERCHEVTVPARSRQCDLCKRVVKHERRKRWKKSEAGRAWTRDYERRRARRQRQAAA